MKVWLHSTGDASSRAALLLPEMFTPRKHYVLPLPGGRTLELGARTLVMGIINVTPDSFADGGLRLGPERAVADGLRMVADGADILDIGGESTRPGAETVSADEELRRVLPVIEGLAAQTAAPLSIDTYKAQVAREAIARGASIVNDISALQYDPALGQVAADTGAALVLMHNRGRSRDMYEHAVYDDVAADVVRELAGAIERAAAAGVRRERLIVDPGIGFAKRAEHSFAALAHLGGLAELDRPILCGPSRKSFLRDALGDRAPSDREWGTAAAVTASVLFGAHIVRVHGVREMVDAVRVADRLRDGGRRA
jgi:dihydropteroate synthase